MSADFTRVCGHRVAAAHALSRFEPSHQTLRRLDEVQVALRGCWAQIEALRTLGSGTASGSQVVGVDNAAAQLVVAHNLLAKLVAVLANDARTGAGSHEVSVCLVHSQQSTTACCVVCGMPGAPEHVVVVVVTRTSSVCICCRSQASSACTNNAPCAEPA